MQDPQIFLDQVYAEMEDLISGHIFLTGDAGTGKSTLANRFREAHKDEVIMLAPTGIAAVNVKGQTIHRFFHLPARTVNYNSIKFLSRLEPSDEIKRNIIRKAKYIMIDEASMIRADLMDCISWFLEKNFENGPFAGKKIILIGDLDQLPPVVGSLEESDMLYQRYQSEFFFSAHCWQKETFKTIRLTHIFRQSDPEFIRLLNEIKNNRLAPYEIDRLNKMCFRAGLTDMDGIILCSNNKDVARYNEFMLNKLAGDVLMVRGEMHGDFNPKNCTVEQEIYVKAGCRVMIMRNDPEGQFHNGTIGTLKHVEYLENATQTLALYVQVELDNGKVVEIGRFTFESIEYTYDKAQDSISSRPSGQFHQIPIKVAYALSVHKSQGQTFDKIIIDLGERGAFAHGQLYVALSRCRTLEGVKFSRPLKYTDLIYNQRVLEFNKSLNQTI
jgi:ATP-dependent exoDNAse (exonuclease V) alpha subunit